MKTILTSLFFCLLAVSSLAQPRKPYGPMTEFLNGTWKLDSVFKVEDSTWERIQEAEDRVYFIFSSTGQLLLFSEMKHGEVGGFEVLEGKSGTWLRFEKERDIVKVEAKGMENMQMTLHKRRTWATEKQRMCFSRVKTDLSSLILSGNYTLSRSQETSRFPQLDTVLWTNKPGVFLHLDSSGRMKHNLGGNDSGTWKFNHLLELELNGTRGKNVFSLIVLNDDYVKLKPKGADPDSFLRFNREGAEENYPENAVIEYDKTTRTQDSVAVVVATMETGQILWSGKPEGKTWKTTREDYRFTFLQNGTFIYSKGKKEYRGEWKNTGTDYSGLLIITLQGQEQIASYSHTFDYSAGAGIHDWYCNLYHRDLKKRKVLI